MDVVGRYIAIILAVILIVLFPLQYIAAAQSETMDKAIGTFSTDFAETARHQGYITLDMYEDYIYKLSQSGEHYDITMEVAHPITGKELPEASIGDKMPDYKAEKTSFIKHSDLKIQSTEADATEQFPNVINSLAVHTHTDSCYNGTQHICSPYGGSCYTRYSYTYYCGGCLTSVSYCSGCTAKTTYCSGCVKQYYGWVPCPVCNGTGINKKGNVCGCMDGDPYGWWTGYNLVCPGHMTLTCPGHTSSYCPGHTGYGYNKTCGKVSGAYYNGSTRVYETCNQVVTDITAANPAQTVLKGNPILTTAAATYLDGHVAIVNCTSDYNSNITGTQSVTLTYTGLVGNAKTTGTKTCTILVTVNEPYKLVDITVTPTVQTIQRYTNPVITVNATYDNGSYKKVTGFTILNFNNYRLGNQIITVSYTEGGITKTTDISVIVSNLTKICPVCGTVYEMDEMDVDNGCPYCSSVITDILATPERVTVTQGGLLPITVEALYANGSRSVISDWSSNYDSGLPGIQEVMINYQGMQTKITAEVVDIQKVCPICSEKYILNEDGTDPGCPLCRKEVISITSSPRQVTIEKHQPLPLMVTATFRDGHTEQVTDWSTDLVTDTSGVFDASIYYKSVQDHVLVTITEEDSIVCEICGLEYSFSKYPEGCPVCYKTITGIQASLRNGGSTVQYNSELNLQIVIIYKDTHRELKYTGWTAAGYQPDFLGKQSVTVTYQGYSTTLLIEVVNGLPKLICPNGHEYYPNEDGSDPGCPYCQNETDRENAVFFFDITYTNDIIEKLYDEGIYYLKQGDYLTLRITPRNTSLRSKIKNMFFGTNRAVKGKSYTFGGEVI